MKKTQILLGVVFLFTSSLWGQSTRHWSLQANVNFHLPTVDQSYFSFGGFTPSAQLWTSSGVRHQLEWTRFAFSSNRIESIESVQRSFQNAWRYEPDFLLLGKDRPLSFYFGPSGTFAQFFAANNPWSTNRYLVRSGGINLRIAAVPLVIYTLTQKLYMELALPWALVDFSWSRNYSENPALTLTQRSSNQTNLTFFPSYLPGLRLGLGVRI